MQRAPNQGDPAQTGFAESPGASVEAPPVVSLAGLRGRISAPTSQGELVPPLRAIREKVCLPVERHAIPRFWYFCL